MHIEQRQCFLGAGEAVSICRSLSATGVKPQGAARPVEGADGKGRPLVWGAEREARRVLVPDHHSPLVIGPAREVRGASCGVDIRLNAHSFPCASNLIRGIRPGAECVRYGYVQHDALIADQSEALGVLIREHRVKQRVCRIGIVLSTKICDVITRIVRVPGPRHSLPNLTKSEEVGFSNRRPVDSQGQRLS